LEIQYREGNPRVQRLMRRALGVPHVLLALSEHWRAFLAELTALPGRLVVVPNSVDPAVARAMDDAGGPLSGQTPPEDCLVLFMGGVGVRKGVQEALRAVPLVRRQVPGVRFVFAGPPAAGQEGESLLLAGQAPEMGGAVSFPGMVTGAAKLDLLAGASIFILPSYQENLPVALLEAMAMGLPVVTTPVAGIPDMVEEGRNGFLVPPGDYVALAERIVRLAHDPGLRRSMGEANVAKVRQEYHPALFARRIADVYRKLLDEPAAADDSARQRPVRDPVQDDLAGNI
jgi:glycosyltransferase involved in cell wall biosynthesis